MIIRSHPTQTNYRNSREYFPLHHVSSSVLPSHRTHANYRNHVVVNPSSSSTPSLISTQNHLSFHSNPLLDIPENNHNPVLDIPEYHPQNNHPDYLLALLECYYSQNNNSEISNMMGRLNIGYSGSHAQPPDWITSPSYAHAQSNTNNDEVFSRCYSASQALNTPPPTREQQRCLVLQSMLEESLRVDDNIFSEVMGNIGDFMVDQYGHRLVIDLLNKCDSRQASTIVKELVEKGLMIHTCLSDHGCKVIQTLFDQLSIRNQRNEIRMVCAVLEPRMATLIDDDNNNAGFHVIKKCLEVFDFEDNQQVAEVIVYNARRHVVDKKGIILLNACIKIAPGYLLDRIIDAIEWKAVSYSKHPYGNYVVQCLLKTRNPRVIARIVAQLKGSFVSMSVNKHASNVAEHCILYGTQEQVNSIITELTNDPHFAYMIHDEFGNYVAQSALKKAQGPYLIHMLDRILQHMGSLECHPYGRSLFFLARTKARSCQPLHHLRRGHLV